MNTFFTTLVSCNYKQKNEDVKKDRIDCIDCF